VFNLNVKGPLFLAQVCCSLILIWREWVTDIKE
jgi:hypothetical protein